MSLEEYRRKRNAARTPEPVPEADPVPAGGSEGGIFVVQRHQARRLHYDFRLERDGVLVSWAIPKGVPEDPVVNHLAVPTEDHPLEYASFTGTIPAGEYGGGVVEIFDRGHYDCVKWDAGDVKVVLHGKRLTGGYALFRTGDDTWMIHRERQPLPTDLRPMLAVAGGLPDTDDGWSYELKWDGQRALAYLEGGKVRLYSRIGRDISVSYPELAGLAATLRGRQVLLDGEIVAFADGKPSFSALQRRMHTDSPGAAQHLATQVPATYLVFDILQLDGRPLTQLPYSRRRELLEELQVSGPAWITPPAFNGTSGADVLRASQEQSLEGIVAKRLNSPYRPGARSPDWRKVKNLRRQEVVVGGWRPGEGTRAGGIGSLLIGVYGPEGLTYAGRVGSGFDQRMLELLARRLAPLASDESPFAVEVPRKFAKDAKWVRPVLVVEVAFDRWTEDDRLRHPVFAGLRDDKDPEEVIREPG